MWIEILLGLGLLFLYVYRYITKNFDEFKKKGIPYMEPSFPFGSKNAKSAIMGQVGTFKGFFKAKLRLSVQSRHLFSYKEHSLKSSEMFLST